MFFTQILDISYQLTLSHSLPSSAHQKFVTKWLEKNSATNPNAGPTASEKIEAETQALPPTEDSVTVGNTEIPPTIAAVEAEGAK